MKPGALWPVAIIGVLAVTVGANIWLFYEARDPNVVAIEPDYYRKAVAWDSTMAQAERDVQLGWRAEVTTGALNAGGTTVAVTLADSTGAPLEGAAVRVECIHNADALHHRNADLPAAGAGRYEGRVPLPRAGLWEVRITARRGTDLFTSSLRTDVPRGAKP
ncbi:MAG: FixH family protein [Candidatus Eisenbacteria bacterium]